MNRTWDELCFTAKAVLKPRKISEWVEAGGVAAAIETDSGNIYNGVCVDGACALGICAERNAIFNMITNGEGKIKKAITTNRGGGNMSPCGTCREPITQLMPKKCKQIEIMLNYEKKKVVTLDDLTPEWWI